MWQHINGEETPVGFVEKQTEDRCKRPNDWKSQPDIADKFYFSGNPKTNIFKYRNSSHNLRNRADPSDSDNPLDAKKGKLV